MQPQRCKIVVEIIRESYQPFDFVDDVTKATITA